MGALKPAAVVYTFAGLPARDGRTRMAAGVGAVVRRSRRSEARPLVDLSDSHPAEVSDLGPALTANRVCPNLCPSQVVLGGKWWQFGDSWQAA
jgi:hypothetical protein